MQTILQITVLDCQHFRVLYLPFLVTQVVALYILVLEKAGSNLFFQSCVQSIQSAFGISFAGFIIGTTSVILSHGVNH